MSRFLKNALESVELALRSMPPYPKSVTHVVVLDGAVPLESPPFLAWKERNSISEKQYQEYAFSPSWPCVAQG